MIKIKKIYQPIFKRDYSTIIYYGGRSSGKSYGVNDSLIIRSRMEKLKIVYCRETKQSMEKSIVALTKSRIEHFGFTEFKINKDYIQNKITGSEFFFIGLNDSQEAFIQGIKGIPDIDILVIEEAQSISKTALEVLIPTVRRNQKGSLIIPIFNPISKQDPIWDLVENPREGTLIHNVNYTENTFCPPETRQEAEHCKIHKPKDYEHIWLGKPKDVSDLSVVKYFNKEKHIKDFPYFMDEDLHITCDFNVDPMMWVIAHKDEQKVFFIDEIVMENTNVKETAKEFLNRYPKHLGKIVINGDASGNNRDAGSDCSKFIQLRNALLEFGYNDVEIVTRRGNPLIVNRIDAFNNKMLNDEGEPDIYFSSKCKWLLYNIKKLCFKTGTSVIDTPTPTALKNNYEDKFLVHIFDAASYLVEYYFPLKAQYPIVEQDKDKTIWEQYA